jgi:hypothetical protein
MQPSLLNRKSGSVRVETGAPQIALLFDVVVDDLLVGAYHCAAPGGHVWPSGWTLLHNITTNSGSLSIAVHQVGTQEPAVITLQTGSGKGAYTVFAVRGASAALADLVSVASSGNSAYPNPAALTLASAKLYAYLTYAFWGGRTYLRAYPTGYGYFDYSIWDNSGSKGADKTNCALATSFRQGQLANAEDVGPFALDGSAPWTAVTLALSPR